MDPSLFNSTPMDLLNATEDYHFCVLYCDCTIKTVPYSSRFMSKALHIFRKLSFNSCVFLCLLDITSLPLLYILEPIKYWRWQRSGNETIAFNIVLSLIQSGLEWGHAGLTLPLCLGR